MGLGSRLCSPLKNHSPIPQIFVICFLVPGSVLDAGRSRGTKQRTELTLRKPVNKQVNSTTSESGKQSGQERDGRAEPFQQGSEGQAPRPTPPHPPTEKVTFGPKPE